MAINIGDKSVQLGAVGVFAEHQSLRVQGESLEYIVDLLANVYYKVCFASQNPDLICIAEGANAAA